MRKKILIAVAVAVLLGVIVAGSVMSGGSDGEKVYVEPVKTQKLESVVTAPAEINPSLQVNIGAHIVGKIEHLYIKEGDIVRRNQKLVDLEPFAYTAQLQRAQADLSSRRIEVERAKAALATADLAYKRATNMEKQEIGRASCRERV